MKRMIYLGVFAVLAVAAAVLTMRAQHSVAIVVANRDVKIGEQLQSGDVSMRSFHTDSVPGDAAAATDSVVGQYVAWPLTSGEPIAMHALAAHQSGSGASQSGFQIPSGYRAVSVPVDSANAVGGMLAAGDKVDVYATPQAAKQAAVSSPSGSSVDSPAGATIDPSQGMSTTHLVGKDALVLQLRNDQGQQLANSNDNAVHGLNFGSGKLNSVVVAVPTADVGRYAEAAANESMFLSLSIN